MPQDARKLKEDGAGATTDSSERVLGGVTIGATQRWRDPVRDSAVTWESHLRFNVKDSLSLLEHDDFTDQALLVGFDHCVSGKDKLGVGGFRHQDHSLSTELRRFGNHRFPQVVETVKHRLAVRFDDRDDLVRSWRFLKKHCH